MNDERDLWTPLAREPSAAEFEAAEAEHRQRSVRKVVLRTLWRLAALLVVVALLAYFIVPFNGFLGSSLKHEWHRLDHMLVIPLAPQPVSPPKVPA